MDFPVPKWEAPVIMAPEGIRIDPLLELIVQRPIPKDIGCPYCGSQNVNCISRETTLLDAGEEEDTNHTRWRSECRECNRQFMKHRRQGHYWYTAYCAGETRDVIKGVPTCWETYTLTCAECGGPVNRYYTKQDGITPDEPSAETRIFFRCEHCPAQCEYPTYVWFPDPSTPVHNLQRDPNVVVIDGVPCYQVLNLEGIRKADLKDAPERKLYYLLVVFGDLDPEMMGPFESEEERDQEAVRQRKADPSENNGIYWMDFDVNKMPNESGEGGEDNVEIGAYTSSWLNGEEDG